MTAVLDRCRMGRGGGRTGAGKTVSTRVFQEEGEMLYWIGEVTGTSSATILRPMIRPELTELYARHKPLIDKLKEMRAAEAARAAGADAPPADPTPRRRRPGGS